MISRGDWHGLAAWTLAGPAGALTVVPQRGAKIVSLVDSGRREWLLQGAPSPPGLAFVRAEMCGWDECAPTIDACHIGNRPYGDHGDLWDIAWGRVADDTRLTTGVRDPRGGYEFWRCISATEDGFAIDYEVIGHTDAPLPFLWALHPQFVAWPQSRVELPGVREVVDIYGGPPRSIDQLQDVPDGHYGKFWTGRDERPTAAVLRHPDGRAVHLLWRGDAVRYASVWTDAAAIAAARVIAIEPATGWYDDASVAAERGTIAILPPRGRLSWHLEVSFE